MTIIKNVPDQIVYTTVRIESFEKRSLSVGTGFLYRFIIEKDKTIPVVITNKHVVMDGNETRLHFHMMDENQKIMHKKRVIVTVEDTKKNWIPHPNPNIDLCALPIANFHHIAKEAKKDLFYIGIDKELIPTENEWDDFSSIEDIIMVGYPIGLWDTENNFPIVRKGITATSPRKTFCGKEEFLIDCACFPGSSGSPVFLYNMGTYLDGEGNIALGSRIKLLGILYAGPVYDTKHGFKTKLIPTRTQKKHEIPINLGTIIKSTKLEDFRTILLKR